MRILLMISIISLSVIALSFVAKTNAGLPHIPEDSLAEDRLKYMNQVLESIKGKEGWKADSVFKNLKVITGKITAKHFLLMMNYGWSTELGVSCSYCHDVRNWESDSIEAKNIARGMWNMRQQINGEILPKITGKDYWTNPKVTCITCHRKKPKPDAP
ncbi:MAG TPA: c-type cytochrome [Puia sp.]|nr:c-type cytochrome [Puia sp.]